MFRYIGGYRGVKGLGSKYPIIRYLDLGNSNYTTGFGEISDYQAP